MAELVDALGSGSSECILVRVRLSPSAPTKIKAVILRGYGLCASRVHIGAAGLRRESPRRLTWVRSRLGIRWPYMFDVMAIFVCPNICVEPAMATWQPHESEPTRSHDTLEDLFAHSDMLTSAACFEPTSHYESSIPKHCDAGNPNTLPTAITCGSLSLTGSMSHINFERVKVLIPASCAIK